MRKTFTLFTAFIIGITALMTACSDRGILDARRPLAEGMIRAIDKFKQQNGRLPNDQKEVDVKIDEGGPFYRKVSETKYLISVPYGLDQDEFIYDSDTKKWHHSRTPDKEFS